MQILYATDGSDGALAGARFLNALRLDEGSQVDLLTVVERGSEESAGEAALARTAEALSGSAAQVVRHTRRGNAAEQTLEAAEERPPDLIAVGTRGASGLRRFFLGSVAERVARHAACPVLLVRPEFQKLDRVILGVDSSERSERAARWLTRFPLPPECETRLVTVAAPVDAVSASRMMAVPPVAERLLTLAHQEREEAQTRLDSLAAAFAAAGGRRPAVQVAQDAAPASGLLDVADKVDADLIAVGSQGLTGIDRFLLGSVSEKVLRHARCSVLVVKETDGGQGRSGGGAGR